MSTYILPKLGRLPIVTVGTAAIRDVLRPVARDLLLEKRRPAMQSWADAISWATL